MKLPSPPVLAFLALCSHAAAGEFDLAASQLDLVVAPGHDHVPVDVAFAAGDAELADLEVTSDQTFVTGGVDPDAGVLRLTFATADLITSQSTATLTVSGPDHSEQLFVSISLGSLDVVHLADDPTRSRTYGLHDPIGRRGALIIHDPIAGKPAGCLGLGRTPSDLAISPDGAEMAVICPGDKQIWFIDLQRLTVSEVMSLPEFGTHLSSGEASYRTTSNIAYGADGIIYYTDEAWAPALRVLERESGTILQTLSTSPSGVGDFALNPAGTKLVTWAQYGYGAGQAGSHLTRYAVAADGTLAKEQETPNGYPNGLLREPYNTPIHFRPDGESFFVKQYEVPTADLNSRLRTFGSPLFSADSSGALVATATTILQSETGNSLFTLPGSFPIQTFTTDGSFFLYFDAPARAVRKLDLLALLGPGLVGADITPAEGAIVRSPAELSWSPMPGIERYAVFLGTDATEVAEADSSSPLFLGEVEGATSIALEGALDIGTTYFWRISPISRWGVQPGSVHRFRVSDVSVSPPAVRGATVVAHPAYQMKISLDSDVPVSWSASSQDKWIDFVSTGGAAPSELVIVADATRLAPGSHSGSVVLETAGDVIDIPVTLEVAPLNLTHVRSEPGTDRVFAISESDVPTPDGAYLLELDASAGQILRVAPAGSNVTDFAIHEADDRIYIANWGPGKLLALDLETLELEQTYGFKPKAATGYGDGDVYRIAAAGPGRLVVEEQDQWIDIGILDTGSGEMLATSLARQGGGAATTGGRYYFHGDDNISNASLHKYDLTGDAITLLGSARASTSSYYGSRVVTASGDGSRIFWNGVMFDANLTNLWAPGAVIRAASHDGRLAFSQAAALDTATKSTLLPLPENSGAMAFNDASGKLVVQAGGRIQFYEVTTDAAPPAPELHVADVGATQATLEWTSGSLVSGFTIQLLKGSIWTDIASPGGNAASQGLESLTPSTVHKVRIKSQIAGRSSPWSAEVTFTTTAEPPPVPGSFWATTLSYGQNRLTWSLPHFQDQVEIFRAPDLAITEFHFLGEAPAGTGSFVDGTAVPGSTYRYKIRSVKGELRSAFTFERVVHTMAPMPPGFTSATPRHDAVVLKWSGVTLTESSSFVYLLERLSGDGESWIEVVRTLVREHEVTGLAPETSHTYRVSLVSSSYESGPSEPRLVTTLPLPPPAAVDQVRLLPGEGVSFSVAWTASTLARQYRVERRVDESSPWQTLAEVEAPLTHYADSSVHAGFSYTYRILAINEVGASPASAVVAATAAHHTLYFQSDFADPPDQADPVIFAGGRQIELSEPGGQTNGVMLFDGPGNRRVLLSLSSPYGYGMQQPSLVISARFRAFAAASGVPEAPPWEGLDENEDVFADWLHLPATGEWESFQSWNNWGHPYLVWQDVHDGPGLDTWALDDLTILIQTPPPPGRVPLLTLQRNGDFNVALQWYSAPNAWSYRVERSGDGLHWQALATTFGNTWHVDESFVPGAEYLYRVVAVNPGGEAAPSPVAVMSYPGERRFDFNGEALTLAEAAARLDPDGRTWLSKFALGMDIGTASSGEASRPPEHPAPRVYLDPASRRLTADFFCRRDLHGEGVRYRVEVSDDARHWTELASLPRRQVLDSRWERLNLEDVADPTHTPRRFMRICVDLEN